MPKTKSKSKHKPAKRKAAARKRITKLVKSANIRAHLTASDIAGALNVIRSRIGKNDVRVALYVLDQYFGKPAQQTEFSEKPKKPVNLHVSNEFLDKLARKYFPKPDWDAPPDSNPENL